MANRVEISNKLDASSLIAIAAVFVALGIMYADVLSLKADSKDLADVHSEDMKEARRELSNLQSRVSQLSGELNGLNKCPKAVNTERSI